MKKKTLCVVPCGDKKIWDSNPDAGPTPAKDVYIGNFAGPCKAYALKFYPEYWCTISAKYGFLFPDDIVPESYNVTFNKRSTNPIRVIELEDQAKKFRDGIEEVVVVAGARYANIVEKVFPEAIVIKPLKGIGALGYMKSALKNALKNDEPLPQE